MGDSEPRLEAERLIRALQDTFGWWVGGWAMPGSMRGDGDFRGMQRAMIRHWLWTQYLGARSFQELVERDDGMLSDSIRRLLATFPPALRAAARQGPTGDPIEGAAWVGAWTRALATAIETLDGQSRESRARGTEGAVPDPFAWMSKVFGGPSPFAPGREPDGSR